MLLWTLLGSSVQPVLKILILCSVGAFCAHKGLLNADGRKVISSLAFLVFCPALNFTDLAGSLSVQRLLIWWPLVVNTVCSMGVAAVLGLLQNMVLKTDPWFRPHVVLASALGNLGNLPLVIITTLAAPSSGVVLRGVPDGEALNLAVAYVLVGAFMPMAMQFTFFYRMLERPVPPIKPPGVIEDGERTPTCRRDRAGGDVHLVPRSLVSNDDKGMPTASSTIRHGRGPSTPHRSSFDRARHDDRLLEQIKSTFAERQAAGTAGRPEPNGRIAEDSAPYSFLDSSAASRSPSCAIAMTSQPASSPSTAVREPYAHLQLDVLPGDASYRDDDAGDTSDREDEESAADGERRSLLASVARPFLSPGGQSGVETPCDTPTPSTAAAAGWSRRYREEAGVRLGQAGRWVGRAWRGLVREVLSPPFGSILLAIPFGTIQPLKGLLFGPDAHLALITDCLRMLSDCCIPAMMLGLGATLVKGPGTSLVPVRTIFSLCVVRLVLVPLVGTAIVMAAYRAGLFYAPDEIMLLVLLIQNCSPTAIALQTMCLVQDNGHQEVATLLFWQYLISVLTVPAFLILFLWFTSHFYTGPM